MMAPPRPFVPRCGPGDIHDDGVPAIHQPPERAVDRRDAQSAHFACGRLADLIRRRRTRRRRHHILHGSALAGLAQGR